LFHFEAGPYWKLLIEAGLRIWALFGFGYATALALAAHIAWRRFEDRQEFPQSVAIVAAASVLGLLMLYYYIGRSATPILTFISLPLFVLALYAVDWAIANLRGRDTEPDRRISILAPAVLAIGVICFPLMGGVFADKFFRPFDQHLSNSSVLRALVAISERQKIGILDRIRALRRTTAENDAYPQNEAGGSLSYAENNAAFEAVRGLASDEARAWVFVADPVPVIFHTPKPRRGLIVYPPHSLGIAYPAVDGLSMTLFARALSAADAARPNDVVILGQLPGSRLDQTMLQRLRDNWQFCRLEWRPNVTTYRLRPRDEPSC
jgi:hypothetical protein